MWSPRCFGFRRDFRLQALQEGEGGRGWRHGLQRRRHKLPLQGREVRHCLYSPPPQKKLHRSHLNSFPNKGRASLSK